MRTAYWMLMLVVPAALFAQITFDPMRLDNQDANEYYYPLLEGNGSSLLCAWSYVSDTAVATFGTHATLEGQLTDPVTFGLQHREAVYCPPKLTYLHATNGSRPYMLYHSCTSDFEFYFYSPEGQRIDSMHRGNVIGPTAAALPDGIFLTYESQSQTGHQVLVWTNNSGGVTREDTILVNQASIKYVYAEGTHAVLVEYHPHGGAPLTVDAVLHPFDTNGNALPTDTLYSVTLPGGWTTANDPAFDYTDGLLRMLIPTVQVSPLHYNLQLLEHTPGNTTIYDAFDPGPFPAGRYASNWSVAPGPWGTNLIGFTIAGGTSPQEIWLEGLNANGENLGLVHIVQADTLQTANGVDMIAVAGTVYAEFATNPLPDGARGGAWLFAFPQEEILAAGDGFAPHPSSFVLSSYPNPFNAVARLDYELLTASPVDLTIYDITGRQAATLISGMQTAGRHSVSWNAENMPSGIYLARLDAGTNHLTRKLVLLK